ncbi:MAG: DMT family transporter [Candidatus Heimdallarchaeota archaeon]
MIGEIIAILAVLTFVGSNVLYRKTEKEASPTFINFIRTAIGTVTFIIISLILRIFLLIFSLPWDLWIILFLSFLFGQVIGDTSYFYAQKILGTTIALAISMTFPLFTFFLSLIFLNRPFEILMIVSLLLIGIGITIIGNSKIKSTNDFSLKNRGQINKKTNKLTKFSSSYIFKGLLYGLLASVGWAIGLVIIDYATNRIDSILNLQGNSSIIGNVIRFPFALSILAIMVFREKFVFTKNKLSINRRRSKETWLLLTIASIIGTSLGAYFYTEAARIAGANIMSLLATSSPLFALPLTYWINNEKITKQGFIGVILTIVGVIIIIF